MSVLTPVAKWQIGVIFLFIGRKSCVGELATGIKNLDLVTKHTYLSREDGLSNSPRSRMALV